MALYLVTGGAGFIGSNIVAELVKRGDRVRVLDNFSTGSRGNLLPFRAAVEIIEGGITDLETVRAAVRSVDVIFHEAALPSVPRSVDQPINSNDVNVGGTLNVLVAGKDEGVKRVVLASSSSVYGDTGVGPKNESLPPLPLSPYAVSKAAGEHYSRVFHRLYGLETIALRYFNVFGPNQDPHSQYSAVIPKFIRALMKGEAPIIYGDGTQSRDFTYVENIVNANLLAAHAPNAGGQTLNIACGQGHTLKELVEVLNTILGTNIKPVFQESRKGDVRQSSADITRAKDVLGYVPHVQWADGLRRTVEWYSGRARGNKGTAW